MGIVRMLPVLSTALCCEVPRFNIAKMPRVVPDQREKFENDEFFRKLSREMEVKYTGSIGRPHEERQLRFQADCREGHADMAFVGSGTNLSLSFISNPWSESSEERVPTRDYVDFDREPGKVHLKSQFIMNGVCVLWRGWVDIQRLDGTGCLEFDEDYAKVEDELLREQIEQYNHRLREFEDRQRQYRDEQERQAEAEAEGSPERPQYSLVKSAADFVNNAFNVDRASQYWRSAEAYRDDFIGRDQNKF